MAPKVARVGARSPLGLTSLQVAMFARAAKLDPRSCGLRDKRGVYIGVCRASALPDDMYGIDRWLGLGAPALRECMWGVTSRAPLLLALPEEARPDNDEGRVSRLVEALAQASGAPVDVAGSAIFRAGSAGFALAVLAATARLSAGAKAVLVGGIDSFYHPGVLSRLDEDARLHSASVEGGVIPSEGAAFALLVKNPAAIELSPGAALRPLSMILGAEADREETALSDEPNLGRAMTSALRRVAVTSGLSPASWILSDWNGERHRVNEWQKVESRSRDFLPDSARHDHLNDEIGEMGAATGPMLLTIASHFWRSGCAPADATLIALHSDGADRGALAARRWA